MLFLLHHSYTPYRHLYSEEYRRILQGFSLQCRSSFLRTRSLLCWSCWFGSAVLISGQTVITTNFRTSEGFPQWLCFTINEWEGTGQEHRVLDGLSSLHLAPSPQLLCVGACVSLCLINYTLGIVEAHSHNLTADLI